MMGRVGSGMIRARGASNAYAPLLLFSGESNSGGYALNSDASAGELAARSVVKILNNTTLAFQDLDVGTNNIIGHASPGGLDQAVTHGLEIGIANTVDASRWPTYVPPVYLVKTGAGGSTVAQWASGNGSGYLTTLQTRVSAARDLISAAGLTAVPMAVVSIGINDSIAGTSATTWKTAMIQYIADIRTALGSSTAPVVLTQFQAMGSPDTSYDAKMAEIAAADSNVYVIDTTGLALRDSHHWSYQGFLGLAEKVLDTLYGSSGTLATPTASPDAGTYGSTQSVTLSGPSGADIRYTTDGSLPSSHSTIYSSAISVAASSTIKAIAIKRGWKNSAQASLAYTIGGAAATWSTSDNTAWFTLTNSNLTATRTTGTSAGYKTIRSTTTKSSGKVYAEMKAAGSQMGNGIVGIQNGASAITGAIGYDNGQYGLGWWASGSPFNQGFTSPVNFDLANPVLNDVIGFALDLDTGKVWIAKNNTWLGSGNPAAGTSPAATWTPATLGAIYLSMATYQTFDCGWTLQCVSGSQSYSPPSGFTAWG